MSIEKNTSLNVLLVEDLEDDRFLFEHAFTRSGVAARLFMANDGQEAIEYFQHQGRFTDPQLSPAPDIVFLDLKMPGCNGFDVLRWLQQQGSLNASLKVFILSGAGEAQDMELSRKLGAREYLVKPITPELLQQLVRPESF